MTLCALAIGRLAYGLLLPAMRAELSLSVSKAGNLGTACSLGYLILVVPAGFLASQYGPRISMLVGLSLIGLSSGGMALISSYVSYLTLMLSMGFGTALLYTPLISLLVGWFPKKRGTVIGIANSGIGIGLFAIGLLIPRVIASQGNEAYRTVWFLFAVFTLVVMIAAFVFVQNPPAVAETSNARTIDKDRRAVSLTKVLRNKSVRSIAIIYGALGIGYIVTSIFMYSYALESGIDPMRAGAMVSVSGFLSIFAGGIWGGLSDIIGRALTLMICFTIVGMAIVLPVAFPVDAGFAIHYMASGIVLGGLFTVILAATSERVEPALIPIAVSFVTVVFAVGQLLGPGLAGLLIERTGGFSIAFTGSGALMATGTIFSYRLWCSERISCKK